MRRKITERCISDIQDHLKDYVMEHSSKNKSRKFTCFNKSAHNNKDDDPSAGIVPGSRGRYWNCFSCGAKGDILTAAQYNEGIDGFHNSMKFLSAKYNINIEMEDPQPSTKRDIKPKQNSNYKKETTANYYYED
ncbi:hypothetical protein [Clostridium psychrophilum]|uniref:hypothetical protein n=1 Tax=Clostridium psychrophilum TaxID=132926 RepID=UPI001C0BF543|nr:hypothetical protein [Clostridium psychrophilum]MBU3182539.1 hypothetical protein [Clostridium psychrophilum]